MLDGPGDGEIRIVPHDSALCFGRVELGRLVREESRLAGDAEPVCEAGRNVELAFVVAGKHDADPPPEARRSHADIERDVVDRTIEHGDQFALPLRMLKMQTSEHAARRPRQVILHENAGKVCRAVAVSIPELEKKASTVAEHLRLNDDD